MTSASMFDLIVVGTGPAGSAAAITAARGGARTLLLERGRYPRHKVCGEFVSAEAIAALRGLVAEAAAQMIDSAPHIARARIHLGTHILEGAVRPAAVSIPRYALDAALWHAAEMAGADCRQQTWATGVTSDADAFCVALGSESVRAGAVIDATGRWSNLRTASPGITNSRWLGLKAHFVTHESCAAATDLFCFRRG